MPIGGLKARGVDDHIAFAHDAVLSHDAALTDALDPFGDELDIVAHQSRIEIIHDQHALAADRIIGRQLLAQRLVRDLCGKVIE